ncbi:fructose-bisphosphatase class II [Enterobacter intestinihominis]
MGRGDKKKAHRGPVHPNPNFLNNVNIQGTIVNGETEKEQTPNL